MKELHIIAACADRKRLEPAPRAKMRTLRNKTIAARVREWRQRLRQNRSTRVIAEDLYLGEYWSTVRKLPAIAQAAGFKTTLWVASAGYGLVRATAHVHSYAATFTPDHPDTVIGATEDRRSLSRAWWKQLTQARLLGPHSGDVESLARKHPDAHVIIIGSPTYIGAMHDDIVAAVDKLNDPSRLTIITSPNGPMPALAPYTLYATARWQAALGGTLLSLHARVARELLQRGLDATAVRRSLGQRQQEQERPVRTRLSDIAVQRFIRKSGARTYTTALRRLRDAGFACEQSRFRRLFQARQR